MMEILEFKKLDNNKVSRRELILKEATRMFRNKGYTSSSVRDLAQEVGIEAPSIYSHFKSKEHILKHICFEMGAAFITGLERAEILLKPEEKLRKAIKEHIQVVLLHREASIVMWNEWRHLTDPAFEQFQSMVHDYEIRFKTIIDEGIEKGTFKKQDPEVVTNLILTSLNSLGCWYKKGLPSVDDVENELTEIYFKGILN